MCRPPDRPGSRGGRRRRHHRLHGHAGGSGCLPVELHRPVSEKGAGKVSRGRRSPWSPRRSPAKRVRWGKDGLRREQAEGRGAGSGAGEDAHGHAGGGGRLPVELHGPVPEKAAGAVRPRKKGLRCMRRPLSMGRQFQKFGNSSSEITFTSSRSSTTTTAGRTILLPFLMARPAPR